jgi:hypothetical protein
MPKSGLPLRQKFTAYALECLTNTKQKHRGFESLGAEMVGKLTYYERWIVAFANILFQKAILTPDELAKKTEEVTARHPGSSAQ